MKAVRGMLAVLVLLAFVTTVIALARGAPPGNDQVNAQQVAVVTPVPVELTVTASSAAIYQNESVQRVAYNPVQINADTSDLTGLSTTGDEANREARAFPLLA